MIKKLLLFVSLSFLLSCSDFFDSKNSTPQRGTEKPTEGKNPFPKGFDPTSAPFSEEKMLASIGLNVFSPATREFRLYVENLQLDIVTLLAHLRNDQRDPLSEEAVRLSWKKAMLAFHYLEGAPVGPLTNRGRFLRDNIYSWPRLNLCGIDLEVAKLAQTGKGDSQLLYTLKGLSAIEYLFFEKNLSTQCNPNNPNHRPAFEWAQSSEQQRLLDRAVYAEWIMRELVSHARALEEAWDADGANYSKTLIDNSVYPSVKEATNALTDAMFNIEEVKDRKLGRPLGAHKDCHSPKCPEVVEHEWSGIALDAVVANLRGLYAVYKGQRDTKSDFFGFDDFLCQVGRSDVAQSIDANFQGAVQGALAVTALGTFREQIEQMDAAECKATTVTDRRVPICAFHQDIRITVIKMRTELLAALSLRAPPKHQGDND